MAVAFAGRSEEQRRVGRALEQVAAGGAGGLLVVVGPPGIGKTALLDVAAVDAARRGLPVTRAAAARRRSDSDLIVWAQLARDLTGDDALPNALLDRPSPLDLDALARAVAGSGPHDVILDDVDRGGATSIDVLALVEARVRSANVLVLASSATPLDVAPELRLQPLSRAELAELAPDADERTCHALWTASAGVPARARGLLDLVGSRPSGVDPLVHLALHAPSPSGFLEPDVDLVRLVEEALTVAADPRTRAPLLARLAAALLGDPSAAARRRALADEAVSLARVARDPSVLADVLSRRLHARWDPDAAEDRLACGQEIERLARAAGDAVRQREGVFWRFVALVELGRVTEAELVLSEFERLAARDADAEGAVMALARRAMLALLRGRFETAADLATEVADAARRAGMADAANVTGALRAALVYERDETGLDELIVLLDHLAEQLPGQLYEATAGRLRVAAGRVPEAVLDMERVLAQALGATGPRWLGAMADLATIAVAAGDADAAARILRVMSPYRDRLVVFGGAVTVWGPVTTYLGRLALVCGHVEEAVRDLEEAVRVSERIGALPSVVRSLDALADALAARGDATSAVRREQARRMAASLGMRAFLGRDDRWSLERVGDDWLLRAGTEQARLRDGRGVEYLRVLLGAPGAEVSALDLAAGGRGLVPPVAEPVLDEAALLAFRRRLAELDEVLGDADAAGDQRRAQAATDEREALLVELQRATGIGRRARRTSPEAERARVNVTRTLRATIDRITEAAPAAGAHLQASIRTGLTCRYEPAPGGPARWTV